MKISTGTFDKRNERTMEINLKKLFFSGSWYKKTAVWLAAIAAIIILFFVAVDFNFCYLFGRSPGFDDIKDPVVPS